MCSIPHENPATKHFTSPFSYMPVVDSSTVALSSLIYVKISAHFIVNNTCLWVLIGIADYQMYRQNVADNSLRDQT